ncbi:MAG: prepilin-type N-terminal cleavage/methylation domain-containing protein [Planctomycetes bacterium]|jgi:prepilin-type N-terminal cleavage/methylation domain-containing protein|nr:prepilin-type N-terminal cleavage/methylation domain-containing protein [Planctomycetota bacterium]MCL4730476.1 prepilin-type N-terminal cleavage/methylation domain-containing protein [Planctomycetota bacterium]
MATRRTRRAGFTLIELMIVIGIILLLVGVLVVSFGGVFAKRDNARAAATIATLQSNLSGFENRWGVYPPGTLQQLGELVRAVNLLEVNDTNRGIEAMILALRARREGGPYLDQNLFGDSSRMGNMDNDTFMADAAAALDLPDGASLDLFELLDPWGNPFIYVNINDVRAGTVADRVTLHTGEVIEITAQECQARLRHPVTGEYPVGYALWSVGENGINEYGGGDDITSWPKYEK